MPKKEKSKFRKKKEPTPAEARAKDFIDITVPSTLNIWNYSVILTVMKS